LENPIHLLNAQMALQSQYDQLECEFLKKNYPPMCQKLQYYIDKYLDSQDYTESPLYAMYPSDATLEHITDMIYLEIKDDCPDTIKEFEAFAATRYTHRNVLYMVIHLLFLNELYRRRMRQYLYTLYAPPTAFPHAQLK